jgi:cupin fold WbuC family metalloprotein
MAKIIDIKLIGEVLERARNSARKRDLYCLHEKNDTLMRMINAGLSDTYVQPHKHENPDKLELFLILKGAAAVLTFDDKGNIKDHAILDENGKTKGFEIPPRTWHCFVILSKEAALYELVEGRYDQKTHKKFAPWAPAEENKEESRKYLDKLKSQIKNFV